MDPAPRSPRSKCSLLGPLLVLLALLLSALVGWRGFASSGTPSEGGDPLTRTAELYALAAGREGSARGPERRSLDLARLLVRSTLDGRRPEGLRVLARPAAAGDTDAVAVVPDSLGGFPLGEPGEWEVVLAAPGHVGRSLRLALAAGDRLVELRPASSLELSFHDELGAPVPGVVARLLPPADSGEGWGRDWAIRSDPRTSSDAPGTVEPGPRTASSDVAGRIRWSDLPPGPGYRWGLVLGPRTLLDPPYEREPVEVDDSGFVFERVPEGLSGPFELRPGETRRLHARSARASAIRGRIDIGPLAGPVELVLSAARQVRSEVSGRLISTDPIGTWTCDEDGSFEVIGLLPGHVLLTASWPEEPNTFAFVRHVVTLQAGQQLDLGLLSPAEGFEVAGEARLRTRQGDRVEVATVVEEPGRPLLASLSFWSRAGELSFRERIDESVVVEVGRPFRLLGLPPGEMGARLRPRSDWHRLVSGDLVVPRQVELDAAVPAAAPLLFEVEVTRRLPLTILLSAPGGGPVPSTELHLYSRSTGEMLSFELHPAVVGDPGPIRHVVEVPADTWHVLAHTGVLSGQRVPGTVAAFGEDLVHLEPGSIETILELSLVAGATVFGTARDGEGRPIADEVLHFAPREWRRRGRGSWAYRCRTDGDGAFELSGVAAFDTLVAHVGAREVHVGGPGTRTRVDLVAVERD